MAENDAAQADPVQPQQVYIRTAYSSLTCFDPTEAPFSTWYQLFEEFCIINDIPAEGEGNPPPHNRRRALFLTHIGPRAYEILRTSCLPSLPNQNSIPSLVQILKERYEPPGLKRSNRIIFNKRIQRENETAAEFIAAIQNLASRCDYGQQLNDALLDRLIAGIKHNDTRQKLIAARDLTFAQAKITVLQDEAVRAESRALAQAMLVGKLNYTNSKGNFKSNKGNLNHASKSSRYRQNNSSSSSQHGTSKDSHSNHSHPNAHSKTKSQSSTPTSWGACHRCGAQHDIKTCPAINWDCYHCGKKGHTSKVCKSAASQNTKYNTSNKRHHTHHVSENLLVPDSESVDSIADKLLDFSIRHVEIAECSSTANSKFFFSDPFESSIPSISTSEPAVPSNLNVNFNSNSSVLNQNSNSSPLQQSSTLNLEPAVPSSVHKNFNSNSNFLNQSIGITNFNSNLNNLDQSQSVAAKANLNDFNQISVSEVNSLNSTQLSLPRESDSAQCQDVSSVIIPSSNPALFVSLKINGVPVQMEVDSGAGITIMSDKLFSQQFPKLNLSPSSVSLTSVSGPISVKGEVQVQVEYLSKQIQLPLVVCANIDNVAPLMGRIWLDTLVPSWRDILIQSLNPSPQTILSIHSSEPPDLNHLKSLFPRIFDTNADSTIEGYDARLVLRPNATPIFHKAYPLPFGLIQPVNHVLDSLEKSGKVIRVRQSEWASPAVVVAKKDGGIRLCVDFKRTLNPQLLFDHYPLPRPDDVFANLSKGAVFTSLDLTDAYTQLKLHPDSQNLCVVNTHRGLFQFTRLIYGISSGAPIFQSVMDAILFDIPGVTCYIDNILIQGKDMCECIHRTLLVLSRLDKHNVRLKLPKCVWFVPEIDFLGFIISKNGRSPSPLLTADILNCKIPSNVKEVRSFLGLIGFFSEFLPQFSTVAKPLRDLTTKNSSFVWSSECDLSFNQCKELLVSNDLIVHFDPDLPIVVYADASPVGVGSTLCHTVSVNNKAVDRPVCYASSSLSPTQQNYAQIDREGLAVIFAVTKYHRFLVGRKFTLVTDNDAIKHIFHPDKSIPTRTGHRLQHWAAILQAYSYTIIHRKSEFLAVADALSRLPTSSVIEEAFFVDIPVDSPVTADVVAAETSKDPVLSKVFELCLTGWPVKDFFKKDPSMQIYFKLKDSLTIVKGCLLKSARIVVPQKLQAHVLKLLHEGHPGIVRTKLLARSVVWWPTLNVDIENLVNNCSNCALTNVKTPKVYKSWPPATIPFERVHIDFFEFKKFKFFIIVDAYSRWLNIDPMSTCTSEDVERELLSFFSLWGLPKLLVSDNGPPFDSSAYSEFCTRFNIQILHSPPYSPESNGLAEKGVQIAKRGIEKIFDKFFQSSINSVSPTNLKINEMLSFFLFNYRNTPTSTTFKSPNEMLISFKPRTLLSQLLPESKTVQCTTHLFQKDEIVFIKLSKKMPVLKGTVVKNLGPTRYLVSVDGVLKQVHANQMCRTSKFH